MAFFSGKPRVESAESGTETDTSPRYCRLWYVEKLHAYCQVTMNSDKGQPSQWRYNQNYQLGLGVGVPLGLAAIGATLAEEGPRSVQLNLDDQVDAEWQAALAELAILLGCYLILVDLPWFLSVVLEAHKTIQGLDSMKCYQHGPGTVLLSAAAIDYKSTIQQTEPQRVEEREYEVTAYRLGAGSDDGETEVIEAVPFYARLTGVDGEFPYVKADEERRFNSLSDKPVARHKNFQLCSFVPACAVPAHAGDRWIWPGDGKLIRFSERRDGDLLRLGRERKLTMEQFRMVFDRLQEVVDLFHQGAECGVMDLKLENILYRWDDDEYTELTIFLHDVINGREWDQQQNLIRVRVTPETLAPHIYKPQPRYRRAFQRMLGASRDLIEGLLGSGYDDISARRVKVREACVGVFAARHNPQHPVLMELPLEEQIAHDRWGIGISMLDLMLADGEWWTESGEKADCREEMLGRIQELLWESEQYVSQDYLPKHKDAQHGDSSVQRAGLT